MPHLASKFEGKINITLISCYKLVEKKFVIESNLRRRHLTSFQLVELGIPLLEIEKKLAKKRQVHGGKKGRDIQLGLVSKNALPSIKKGKATAIVAYEHSNL